MLDRRVLLNIDGSLLLAVLLLASIGVLLIFSVTASGPNEGLHQRQALWVAAGVVLHLLVLAVDYHFWVEFSGTFYLLSLAVLVFVLFFGKTISGSRSWISLGFFNFQPSELVKISTTLFLARTCAELMEENYRWSTLLITGGIVALPVGLILLQPDMGTALTFLPLLGAVNLLAGIRLKLVVVMVILGLLLAPLVWQVALADYQKNRVRIFIDPQLDPLGAGYHISQSKIAVGSGGFFGKGLRSGTQSQLRFIPEPHTDFIVSVLAEEKGFLGVLVVLGLYFFVFSRFLLSARDARDRRGTYLAAGLASILLFHVLINVGMVIGLMPITGIPLPLLSYGGSSIISTFIAIGLILNVRARRFVH
jgi:rod shape determining protein RodA